jgi:hypothetical protein
VISLVRFGDGWRDGFNGGKDGQFLAMGVPDQYFIEKPEALNGRRHPGFAARRGKGGRVDHIDIGPEGIVDRQDCIHRFSHFSFLLVFIKYFQTPMQPCYNKYSRAISADRGVFPCTNRGKIAGTFGQPIAQHIVSSGYPHTCFCQEGLNARLQTWMENGWE